MSEPTGFGILALYPGIVEDPPAFSFYRTGVSATIEQYIQTATGVPKLVFSLFTGSQPPLDLISGVNNSFYFDKGTMRLGNGNISVSSKSTGLFNVIWDGVNSNLNRAGAIIWQTNNTTNSGTPSIITRNNESPLFSEISNFVGDSVEFTSSLGGFRNVTLPGIYNYTAANSLSSTTYETPVTNGANLQANFVGFSWGRWDGAQNLYTNLGVYKDYTEIGHFKQTSVKQNLGGEGAFVLRDAVTPTVHHTSGVCFYASASDSSLNLKTQNGTSIQLAPGITGINRLSFSSDIYIYLTSRYVSNSASILLTDNGKILIDSNTTLNHSLIFSTVLPDGFSCEINYDKDCNVALFSTTGQVVNGSLIGPGKREKTTIEVFNGIIYLKHSLIQSQPIFLQTKQFIRCLTSGASTGFYETLTHKNNYEAFIFNQTSPQCVETEFFLPPSWTGFYFQPRFISLSGTATQVSKWNYSARSEQDQTSLDRAFSTPVSSNSTYSSSGIIYTHTTSAIYPSGLATYTYPQNDLVKFRIVRDAGNAADTLAADTYFIGGTITRAY